MLYYDEGVGCAFIYVAIQTIILFIFAWLGNILVGYNLETWLGYYQWEDVNLLVRLLVGIISLSIVLPLGIIAFILSLALGIPILVV